MTPNKQWHNLPNSSSLEQVSASTQIYIPKDPNPPKVDVDALVKQAKELVIAIEDKEEAKKQKELFLNHPTVKVVEKYKEQFKDDKTSLKLLNWMKVIAEDELQLANWIVVKLGYPDIKADNEEIFEKIVQNIEWREIRAIYFSNGKAFKKYQEEMRQKWFRIAWSKKDKNWKIFKKEMNEIFEQFPWKWVWIWNTIILDILWRSFSGYRETGWDFECIGDEENFWSCSPYDEDRPWNCFLYRDNNAPYFDTHGHNFGFGALFLQDKNNSSI